METIKFHPAALLEYEEILERYFAIRPLLAKDFTRELECGLLLVLRSNIKWKMLPPGVHKISLRRFPYVIVFRKVQNIVQVIAISHGKRNPGYWESRLK